LDVQDPATLGCGADFQPVGDGFNEVVARFLAKVREDLAESEAMPEMGVGFAVGYGFQ
jgi:hypothetical protein